VLLSLLRVRLLERQVLVQRLRMERQRRQAQSVLVKEDVLVLLLLLLFHLHVLHVLLLVARRAPQFPPLCIGVVMHKGVTF